MRYCVPFPFVPADHLLPLARAAEDAGFDSFSVPDSLFFPAHSDARYPYNPDGDREFLEDKPILEPFTLIPARAAVTDRLRFTTFVVKAPVRPAVLLAKQAASVAVLSGNRLRLGVGISPWPEDFAALGQPWERRGDRLDKTLAVVRGLTAGGWFEHHGELIDVERMKLSPVPTEPIPILVGGHADRALRRAATLGDGWVHGGGDPADLPRLLGRLAELRREAGREGEPFEVHVISMDAYSVDGVRRLEDAGVTDVVVGFRYPYVAGPDTESLQDKLDPLHRFAENVIAKVA